jgi:cytochrome c peroxidase
MNSHSLRVVSMTLITALACSDEPRPEELGEELFSAALPGTNGRSCATCHVPKDGFTLTPAHVEELLATRPDDPLFHPLDADDPTAEPLTFDHLRKGLVRVWITLPEHVDVLDEEGNVATPADRRIFVWRSVPPIADVAMTAPFQLDGRNATLEEQAQGAVTAHSEGGTVLAADLARIAAFERTLFSSDRAREVAEYLASGRDPTNAPDVEDDLDLSPQEARGRIVYDAVCASCHGGPTTTEIVDREVHDLAFPALRPDGTVIYRVPATDPPSPTYADQSTNEFVNIGSAYEAFQGAFDPDSHSFTKDVSFPQYRLRFYRDASRAEIVAELPPATAPGADPFATVVDEDGNPVIGPNLAIQFFSTDPGRALITGSPHDFEAFDVPSLRGIATTAPYLHNNAAETLEVLVDLYSDHFMARFPPLSINNAPPEPDPDGEIGPPEALSARQKSDLIAFLRRL